MYGSSGVLGTKGGGPWAAAWAVLHYLGDEGYLRVTAEARRAFDTLTAAIESIPELELRARPDSTLLAFGGRDGLDVFAVADELWRHGWYVDRQGPPDSLHCTVNAVHSTVIDEFIVALRLAVENVKRQQTTGSAGAYGTID
jgi:glutamate/tyrosine decarboxylase-like PLP-dependent enzyme